MNIRISPVAFLKMQTLVSGFDKEVGWFGTVERIDDGFRIKDILVFPQYTSAAYIDDERENPLEFREWLNTLTDEEYNTRRFWGHSHVNMGVSPSSTDKNMFKRFKETNNMAPENKFTITAIINKSLDMNWWVYDGDTNKEYKNSEINVMIEVEEGVTNLEYFELMKPIVRDIYPTTHFLFSTGSSSYKSSYWDTDYDDYATGYNYGDYNKGLKERKESSPNIKNNNKKDVDDVQKCDVSDDDIDTFIEQYYSEYGIYDDSYYGFVDNQLDEKIQATFKKQNEDISTNRVYTFKVVDNDIKINEYDYHDFSVLYDKEEFDIYDDILDAYGNEFVFLSETKDLLKEAKEFTALYSLIEGMEENMGADGVIFIDKYTNEIIKYDSILNDIKGLMYTEDTFASTYEYEDIIIIYV